MPQRDWWRDPENVKTEMVQFWRMGVMVTAMMSLEKAREAVRNGNAFVISNQAIGHMVNGVKQG